MFKCDVVVYVDASQCSLHLDLAMFLFALTSVRKTESTIYL